MIFAFNDVPDVPTSWPPAATTEAQDQANQLATIFELAAENARLDAYRAAKVESSPSSALQGLLDQLDKAVNRAQQAAYNVVHVDPGTPGANWAWAVQEDLTVARSAALTAEDLSTKVVAQIQADQQAAAQAAADAVRQQAQAAQQQQVQAQADAAAAQLAAQKAQIDAANQSAALAKALLDQQTKAKAAAQAKADADAALAQAQAEAAAEEQSFQQTVAQAEAQAQAQAAAKKRRDLILIVAAIGAGYLYYRSRRKS